MLENHRGPIYAATHAHFGFVLTPAERRLLDRALDQIKAMRELNR